MSANLMEAAVLYAPQDLRVEKYQVPTGLGPDEALVKVRMAGICGSDLDRVMKTGTYSFPTIPGHEFAGTIVEMGPRVSRFAIGDRVVVAPLLPCWECEYCLRGNYGQCNAYNYLGSRTNGGFAQYVKVPARNLVPMPQEVDFMAGATVEPAAVMLHGLKKAGVGPGDVVTILGCGPVGLFAVQLTKIMGAGCVIAVDVQDRKLELATVGGADYTVNAAKQDPVVAIKKITNGQGVNLAVETAGTLVTQEQCLRLSQKTGRVLYIGTAHEEVVLPRKTFELIIRNEITIYGSWNSYSAPFPGSEWSVILEYMKSGRLKIRPIVSHVLELKKAPEVFKDLVARKSFYSKIVFAIN
jgi:L-iditol 2-dehydrogenase